MTKQRGTQRLVPMRVCACLSRSGVELCVLALSVSLMCSSMDAADHTGVSEHNRIQLHEI